MRTNRRAVFFSAALFSAVSCALGFGVPLPAAPPKDAAAGKNVPRKDADTSLSGVSTAFSATLPDPKRPGRLLYELRGASGNIQADGSGFHGNASSLWARLYQSGLPSAVLTAPQALVKSANKAVAVTGLGGVVVKSLAEPGTMLTADTVVWYANQNKLVATGHVFYRSGKTGATLTGPRMVADTRVKSISVTGGGHGTEAF